MIDGLVAFALLFVGMVIAAIVEGTPAEVPMADTWIMVGMILGALLGWLYQAGMMSSARQATWGMRAVGVMVTDVRGDRLSFARATLRHVCKVPSYFIYGLGLLLQPFTKRRQALHDWLTGTVVLARPAGTGPAPAPIHIHGVTITGR